MAKHIQSKPLKTPSELLEKANMKKSQLRKAVQEQLQGSTVAPNKVPGGLAQEVTIEDLAKMHKTTVKDIITQLVKGAKVEKEHTSDLDIALEIAFDHVYEDPKYYDHLKDTEGKIREQEEEKQYSTEESAAVGKTVAKSLLKVLRAQGDEVTKLKLTGLAPNKFNIHVEYGNEKGQDTFKFNLQPEDSSIVLDLGNRPMELTDFQITQGNTVSLPTPELEDKLGDAMKKYIGEPSDEEYDQMAAMQLPNDDSQINRNIAESSIHRFTQEEFNKLKQAYKENGLGGLRIGLTDNGDIHVWVSSDSIFNKAWDVAYAAGLKAGEIQFAAHFGGAGLKYIAEKHLTSAELKKREEIIKAMKEKGAPKNAKTYAIATAQAKELAELTTNEDLDLGHQDNEPHMLKADLYRIAKYAIELYKMVDQFEGPQEVDFPHWWQAKITNAKSCLVGAKHYLDFELKEPVVDAMLNTNNEIEEETTAKTKDPKHNQQIVQKINTTVTNPNAKKELISKFNAGEAIDL